MRADRGPKAILPNWQRQLIVNNKGEARPVVANVLAAMKHAPELSGRLGYDLLRNQAMAIGTLPWAEHDALPRPWTDQDDVKLTEWLQGMSVFVSSRVVAEGAHAAARDQSYHPIMDYLAGVHWDGTHRCDTWAIDHLGVPDTPYARAVSGKWMISAVARVFNPGCKADCALVLEGKQGIGKSSVLRALGAPWFTDEIAALGTKDASEQLRGVWIVELAELEAVTRAADISAVKAFMSRQIDRYRAAYGRHVEEYPRQCVFAASVNHDTWNRDETGARRWWPLQCVGQADVAGLSDKRDQLWAEARDRYESGEEWWLTTAEIMAAAAREQDERLSDDPWEDVIENLVVGRSGFTAQQIADDMSIPKERQNRACATRIGLILRKMGFATRRQRDGENRQRRYYRVAFGGRTDG